MLQPGKMVDIADEATKFKINTFTIQETRWPGQGRIDKQDYSVFYSGPNSRTAQYGIGYITDAQAQKSLMCFEPISDRMCKIRFKGHFRNLTLISAYAPRADSQEENKHAFYNQLHRECSKILKYDMLLILLDFNAQIGTKAFLKIVAEKYTFLIETNDIGKMLSELAMANNFIVKSTCFNHKRIHKGKGKIPGSEQTNQTDHVIHIGI
jgi:exonuclease III